MRWEKRERVGKDDKKRGDEWGGSVPKKRWTTEEKGSEGRVDRKGRG